MKLNLLILVCTLTIIAHEENFIDQLSLHVPLSKEVDSALRLLSEGDDNMRLYDYQMVFPHTNFCNIPQVALGDFPTPIERLNLLEQQCNRTQVFIKRDDLAGRIINGTRTFGGNKIRKLEFLLGDALRKGARSVMTYGGIGSNHATATASCCRQYDLQCTNLLTPQPNSWVVHRNLLLMYEYGAQLILNPNRSMRDMQTICSFVQQKYNHGDMPYLIPTGGSNAVGVVG